MRCSVCSKTFNNGDIVSYGGNDFYSHTHESQQMKELAEENGYKTGSGFPYGLFFSDTLFNPGDIPPIERREIDEAAVSGEKGRI